VNPHYIKQVPRASFYKYCTRRVNSRQSISGEGLSRMLVVPRRFSLSLPLCLSHVSIADVTITVRHHNSENSTDGRRAIAISSHVSKHRDTRHVSLAGGRGGGREAAFQRNETRSKGEPRTFHTRAHTPCMCAFNSLLYIDSCPYVFPVSGRTSG